MFYRRAVLKNFKKFHGKLSATETVISKSADCRFITGLQTESISNCTEEGDIKEAAQRRIWKPSQAFMMEPLCECSWEFRVVNYFSKDVQLSSEYVSVGWTFHIRPIRWNIVSIKNFIFNRTLTTNVDGSSNVSHFQRLVQVTRHNPTFLLSKCPNL